MEKLKNNFQIFLKNIGQEKQVPYAESIIACDADKCESYRVKWELNNIPYKHGVMIYLITKMKPYSSEARETISAEDFVIKYYEHFKNFLP